MTIRIGTYNIHKCKGMDALVRPERIAKVLQTAVADVWTLQEVLHSQAEYLQASLPDYESVFGRVREHTGEPYGNLTLSRLPIAFSRIENLSLPGREPRATLLTLLPIGQAGLELRNVHLGTSYSERRQQAQNLLDLCEAVPNQPQILAGDFNDWSAGTSIRALDEGFEHLRKSRLARSYPGLLPLMHLDQIYFRGLKLIRAKVVRSRLTIVASDHLPIVAEFAVP